MNDLHVSDSRMVWSNDDITFQPNALIMDVSSANVTITESTVRDIETIYSSAVFYAYNDPSSSSKMTFTIKNSNFTNNTARVSAGVLKSVNTDVVVTDCNFDNNTARTRDGGAMYLSCSDSTTFPCDYKIERCNFANNTASINGGAVKYDFYGPTVDNNNFNSNNAIYGKDMSSYPVKLVL
jgi:hypothetical protein